MSEYSETADEEVVLPPRQGAAMQPYPFIFRLSVLAGLVFASALMGGWKWELLPH
jgi:hypothetical protein